MTLRKKKFKNTLGKGENAGNQHFSPFPTMSSTLLKPNFNCSFTFILLSANALNFGLSKILLFHKELNIPEKAF